MLDCKMNGRDVNATRGFLLFAVLCFLLLGLVPIAAAVLPGWSMDFSAAAARATRQTGIAWTSNIVDVIQLALKEPSLWLLILGSAVPSLAAIVAARLVFGWQGLVKLFARLSPILRRSNQDTKPLVAYLYIPAILVLAMLATRLLRIAFWPEAEIYAFTLIDTSILIPIALYAVLDQGALLEELGWRGFGGPVLEASGFGWLTAAILIGLLWGLWHVPRDLVSGLPTSLGWSVYLFAYLPSFILKAMAVSVFAGAAMYWSGGSIWPAIIAHGITNDAVGISGQATIDIALTPSHQISGAVPLLVAGILIVVWMKKRNASAEH
jgi:membrane protease YdiL (CAAX protease family)